MGGKDSGAAAVYPVHVKDEELLRKSELQDARPIILSLFERGAPLGVEAKHIELLFCCASFSPGHARSASKHCVDDLACVFHRLWRANKDERFRQIWGEGLGL